MNTTIQIRIDQATKTKAQKAFKNMGLDLSSGVKYLLTQVGSPNNLTYMCPFGFMHKYTPEILNSFEKEVKDVIKNGKRYSSTKAMFDDIMAKK